MPTKQHHAVHTDLVTHFIQVPDKERYRLDLELQDSREESDLELTMPSAFVVLMVLPQSA